MIAWIPVRVVPALVCVVAIPLIARARALARHGAAVVEIHGAANDPRYWPRGMLITDWLFPQIDGASIEELSKASRRLRAACAICLMTRGEILVGCGDVDEARSGSLRSGPGRERLRLGATGLPADYSRVTKAESARAVLRKARRSFQQRRLVLPPSRSRQRHFARIPASLISLPHFAYSAFTNAEKSSGLLPSGSAPRSTSR